MAVSMLEKAMGRGRPEYGHQYRLTGKIGTKCIMQGNSWEESEVKKEKEKF